MNSHQLLLQGNDFRNSTQPEQALACYAQAFVLDPENLHAWNNYGNTLREMGQPKRAIPFLEHAIALDPQYVTANFNLSVAQLLAGDYEKGWKQYEWRWEFEHLKGQLPNLPKPIWNGESLQGKTILVCREQGLGDVIQFARFIKDLHDLGAKIIFFVTNGMVELFSHNPMIEQVVTDLAEAGEYDYWISIMSIPRVLNTTLATLTHEVPYIEATQETISVWKQTLGIKRKMRVGVCWSGRKDSWINQHKAVPVNKMIELVNQHPEYDWICLQADTTDEESAQVAQSPMLTFPGKIRHWDDTAGLLHHLDLVISVDTAIAHLAGAMGKTLWIPLNNYAVDWRYLTGTALSPWYPTARLFRQPAVHDWDSVIIAMDKFIKIIKI